MGDIRLYVREDDLDKKTVSADSIKPNLINSIVNFQLKSVEEGKFFCCFILKLNNKKL
jgi:hypothetical protein